MVSVRFFPSREQTPSKLRKFFSPRRSRIRKRDRGRPSPLAPPPGSRASGSERSFTPGQVGDSQGGVAPTPVFIEMYGGMVADAQGRVRIQKEVGNDAEKGFAVGAEAFAEDGCHV